MLFILTLSVVAFHATAFRDGLFQPSIDVAEMEASGNSEAVSFLDEQTADDMEKIWPFTGSCPGLKKMQSDADFIGVDFSDCSSLSKGGSCSTTCKTPRYKGTGAGIECDSAGVVAWSAEPAMCFENFKETEVVYTDEGPVIGWIRPYGGKPEEEVNTFYGIPFAAPPVGNNRWKPPQAVEPWTEVRKSLHQHSPACPNNWGRKKESLSDIFLLGKHVGVNATEDCLFLDAYIPRHAVMQGKRLPVIMHIYGGAFVALDNWGNGMYEGHDWVTKNEVILVQGNFRVGVFGHWTSKALKAESGTTGNYGMQDQRAILQWVQRNIAKFGGDPNRVTLLGFSSGGFQAHMHRYSPDSHGLFHAVITEGAAPMNEWFYSSLDEAGEFYSTLSKLIGCEGPEELKCLRNLDPSALTKVIRQAQRRGAAEALTVQQALKFQLSSWGLDFGIKERKLKGETGTILASPGWPMLGHGHVVDGSDAGLPDRPRALWDKGLVADVPSLVDYAEDEGSFFAMLLGQNYPHKETKWPLTQKGAEASIKWALSSATLAGEQGVDVGEKALELYPRKFRQSGNERFTEMLSDSTFTCPSIYAARKAAELNKKPVYLSEWHYAPAMWGHNYALGATHCYGFTFYWSPTDSKRRVAWPTEEVWWSSNEKRMAAAVQCRLSRMAHCQNPNADCSPARPCSFEGLQPEADIDVESPEWLFAYKPRRLMVDLPYKVEPYSEDQLKRCEFWDKVTFHFVNTTWQQVPEE